ncbi:MAG: sigma-70 family RNA polymerase sigma factor [Planctomycetes bacterium]|nr:sigma-70 family RNA polymerase sigma factor [Planctomycetota bacterium]
MITGAVTHDPTTTFVQTHQHALWRWLRALGCDSGGAEEHIQDALLAGLAHGALGWSLADARRWLRQAAKNLFFMQLRRERRRPVAFDLAVVESAWQRARGDDDDLPLLALRDCLQTLSERDRLAIELRYRERQSRAAMAAALGLGEAGVKMALRRARARLLDCITGKLRENDDAR